MVYAMVMNTLKRCNNDFFEASREIYKDYQRGNFTQEEYLEMMDVLSSVMMWGPMR